MEAQHQASDEELMRQAASGGYGSFESLLRRHATPVLTFIQRMIGHRQRSEEVFQEVFLAVWINRRGYEYPRPFRPWLMTIAVNKCRLEIRKRRELSVKWLNLADDCRAAREPSPAELALGAERAAVVAKAVALLPEGQRDVVILRLWNGLSYSEIAEAVQSSESTTRVQMYRGLRTLRKYLKPYMKNTS
jgi:RNA polymerase sigma-70 factor, ECF subfamily